MLEKITEKLSTRKGIFMTPREIYEELRRGRDTQEARNNARENPGTASAETYGGDIIDAEIVTPY